MTSPEKCTPDATVSEVALNVLALRLSAVVDALPPAARHADEDPEYVHDLRVASRRAVTALQLFADVLPEQRSRRLVKMLEKVRKAAGTARDTDVLLARWQTEGVVPPFIQHRLERSRRRAQKPLISVEKRLVSTGRLSRRIAKLLAKVASRSGSAGCPGSQRFVAWAGPVLAPRVEAFFEASRTSSDGETGLHRFRIAGKDLRYTLEILAGAFPVEVYQYIYPVIDQSQGKTGEITDRAIACTRIEERLARLSSRRKADAAERILRSEKAQQSAAADRFHDWWTPARSGALLRSFQKLLPGTSLPA